MGKCRMCGACCKAIRLDIDTLKLNRENDSIYSEDLIFILKYWKPITLLQAVQINPRLCRMLGANKKSYFYTCTLLKENKCSAYEGRPDICSKYPWYDGIPNKAIMMYSVSCSYYADIKEKINANRTILPV